MYKSNDGVYSGYLPDLFEALGFNITITEADKYGAPTPNGSFDGMMGEIIEKVCDRVSTHITIDKVCDRV